MNVTVCPGFTVTLAGCELITGAEFTVSPDVPETPFRDAVMVTGPPVDTPVASPVALIVAMPALEELHVTWVERSSVLLSVNVPMAESCTVFPARTVAGFGVTAIDTTVAGSTVSVTAGLVIPFSDAVICELPTPTLVARPAELIVATDVVAEFHAACVVMFFVLLSEYVPVAVKG